MPKALYQLDFGEGYMWYGSLVLIANTVERYVLSIDVKRTPANAS